MVHSTPIPAKAQPTMPSSRVRPISKETGRYPANGPSAAQAAAHAAQAGSAGGAIGSALSYGCGSGKYPYPGYPPQQQIMQSYGYQPQTHGAVQSQPQAMGGYACAYTTKGMMPNAAAPGMRASPPYHHHLPAASSKSSPLDRLAAETTDIYTRSLNGIVAAAAASAGTGGAHRKVGAAAVPFGVSKLY